MLSDSLKLKAPSSIYFLGLAKNPQDFTIAVSLDTNPQKKSLEAFPLWVTFVQSTLQCVFLRSHQYQKCPPPTSISHLQWHSQYYNYVPIPMSQFHFLPSPPYRHTLKKGSLSLPHSPCPYSNISLPPLPIQWISPHIASHLLVISLVLLVKETSLP